VFSKKNYLLLKGDTADKKLYRFKFLALFCQLGLKMLGPQQWQLLHVEKDDQVIRHNNNKTWETKHIYKL
jgi:hypothetical protein